MGLIPGLPDWPVMVIGRGLIGVASAVRRAAGGRRRRRWRPRRKRPTGGASGGLLRVDQLEVQVGYQLVPLVDARQGGDLIDRIVQIRKVAAIEMGYIAPPVRVRDSTELKPASTRSASRGTPWRAASWQAKCLLAINPGYVEAAIEGAETSDRSSGWPARWIQPGQREKASCWGTTSSSRCRAGHPPDGGVNAHAHELLGRQETQHLLDELKKTCPTVVEELVPAPLPLGRLQRVLQKLLAERVPRARPAHRAGDPGRLPPDRRRGGAHGVRAHSPAAQICAALLKDSREAGIAVAGRWTRSWRR